MADTKIEWAEKVWNPVTGCSEISPGCAHCYAKRFAERFRGVAGHPYERGFDVQLRPERLDEPLHWHKPRRIFVNSMSDVFHEDVPDEFVADVLDTIWRAHWHQFLLLTKRPERASAGTACGLAWPWPPNLWLGVSVENRHWTRRIDTLREIPAAVRFISAEPLLGDLGALDLEGVDWVIVGGESGPASRVRPMRPSWAQSIRDQCADAGVAFLFKQWGTFDADGAPVGKHKAGRLLDGVMHDEYPRDKSA